MNILYLLILVYNSDTSDTSPPNSPPRRFPSYLLMTLSLYSLSISYFPRCTLPELFFYFFPGFLAIFILFSSHNNNKFKDVSYRCNFVEAISIRVFYQIWKKSNPTGVSRQHGAILGITFKPLGPSHHSIVLTGLWRALNFVPIMLKDPSLFDSGSSVCLFMNHWITLQCLNCLKRSRWYENSFICEFPQINEY